jgi:F-type H+-transporting ATPase subunit b
MIFDTHIFIPAAYAASEAAAEAKNVGLAGTLGIDWKLFIAQLVNFGIILGILWKWVFIPVARKLEERTTKIEQSLTDADRITTEKREFETWRQQEMNKARQEASGIVTDAQNDASKARQAIVEQTKQEQQKLVDQAKQQIESQKNKALAEAKSEMANLVVLASEKILRKKLDSKTDQEYIKDSLKSI